MITNGVRQFAAAGNDPPMLVASVVMRLSLAVGAPKQGGHPDFRLMHLHENSEQAN
jgi:hypothetical protein